MRTIVIAIVLSLAVSAFAAGNKAADMAKATTNAADAVDAAIQVLFDLRQANYDAQAQKDSENATNQINCDNEIADLYRIADINKEAGDATTAHRKYIEKEIADSHAYLEWIDSRRADITRRETELQDQRCYSAQIFVRSLKENSDAIEAIALLRNDLFASIDRKDAGNQSAEELLQVAGATKKLAAYKHLMNEQALTAFNQLAALEDEDVEEETSAPSNSVEEQINSLLDTLEENFQAAIKNFEQSEVKAGWDLAIWLQDSEAELEYFAKEEERTNEYIDKMTIALQAAKATENKAWEIYFQSSSNYHNAITICRHKGEAYLADKHQRDDENALLEDVIKQFKENAGKLLWFWPSY